MDDQQRRPPVHFDVEFAEVPDHCNHQGLALSIKLACCAVLGKLTGGLTKPRFPSLYHFDYHAVCRKPVVLSSQQQHLRGSACLLKSYPHLPWALVALRKIAGDCAASCHHDASSSLSSKMLGHLGRKLQLQMGSMKSLGHTRRRQGSMQDLKRRWMVSRADSAMAIEKPLSRFGGQRIVKGLVVFEEATAIISGDGQT